MGNKFKVQNVSRMNRVFRKTNLTFAFCDHFIEIFVFIRCSYNGKIIHLMWFSYNFSYSAAVNMQCLLVWWPPHLANDYSAVVNMQCLLVWWPPRLANDLQCSGQYAESASDGHHVLDAAASCRCTAQLLYCPVTVLPSYCTAPLLYYNVTVLQRYWTAMLLYYPVTVLPVTALPSHCTTRLLHCPVTVLHVSVVPSYCSSSSSNRNSNSNSNSSKTGRSTHF